MRTGRGSQIYCVRAWNKGRMKVKKESCRVVKPIHEGGEAADETACIPLSVFDTVTFNTHIAVIYAFKPPLPPNSSIQRGLQLALAVYREWAGRLDRDLAGRPAVLLNDAGVTFVEATVDCSLDQAMPLKPSASSLCLHPPLKGVEELLQVQLTRFACGSLVVGFTAHHLVADGHATSNFLVAWGKATRGLDMGPLPLRDRAAFAPRSPPKIQFEHHGVEFVDRRFNTVMKPLEPSPPDDVVVHRAHFTRDFLTKLKDKVAGGGGGGRQRYSTFESLVAHLWRTITRARGLNGFETTQIRISVNGRSRMSPRIPNEYFGNLVLWAFPRARVRDLVQQPLGFAAKLIHDSVAKVNDDYFKSFIDFASTKASWDDNLAPSADMSKPVLCPNMEVDSWLRFPFCDLDFGGGCPHIFMPTYFPVEGMLFLLPSFIGDGSIDAVVPLFRSSLSTFKQLSYSLE